MILIERKKYNKSNYYKYLCNCSLCSIENQSLNNVIVFPQMKFFTLKANTLTFTYLLFTTLKKYNLRNDKI